MAVRKRILQSRPQIAPSTLRAVDAGQGSVLLRNLATLARIDGFVSGRWENGHITVVLDDAKFLALLPDEIEGIRVEGRVGPPISLGR